MTSDEIESDWSEGVVWCGAHTRGAEMAIELTMMAQDQNSWLPIQDIQAKGRNVDQIFWDSWSILLMKATE